MNSSSSEPDDAPRDVPEAVDVEESEEIEETGSLEVALSEEEMEALQGEQSEHEDGIRRFDVTRPRVLRQTQHEGLDAALLSACTLLTEVIKRELRSDVIVEYHGGEALFFDAYIDSLGETFQLFGVAHEGDKLNGVLRVDRNVALAFVDALLGGSAGQGATDRLLTETESAVVSRLLEELLSEIHMALGPLIKGKVSIDAVVGSRVQMSLLNPPTVAYVCRFGIHMELTTGVVEYAIPMRILQPILALTAPPQASERKAGRPEAFGLVGKAFLSSPMEVVAHLGTADLTLKQLADLTVGDVIPLEKRSGEPIEVCIEGVPKLLGGFGLQGGRYAVCIKRWIRDGMPAGS